jgi:hypothetical protein
VVVKPGSGRILTVIAVGFLVLDGVLLVLSGLWARHPGRVVAGAALIGAAWLVLLFWRHHRRRLAEIAGEREALRDQARSLRDLTRRS